MSSGRGTGRGAWERLRSVPGRTPLRVKLITALLALVIIALGLISFASRAIFGGYLTHQAANQLTDYYQSVYGKASRGHLGGYLFVGSSVQQVWILNSHGQPIQVSQGGVPLATSGNPPPDVPTSQAWLNANAGQPVTVPGPTAGDNWLVITQQIPIQVINPPNSITNSTAILVVGTDLGNIRHEMGYLTEIDMLVSLAVIVILAIVGVAVVRASLRPLTDIEQTAAAIAGGDLSSRVPDRDPRTEVGRLGRSLNAMLAQIEAAFRARTESEEAARRSEARMRQFVADASHELRTPLTAIRGYAEYYRQRGGLGEISGAPPRPAQSNGSDVTGYQVADASAESPHTPDDAAVSPRHADPHPEEASPETEGPLARADLDRIMQRVEQESSRMGVLVEDMLLLARLDQQRPLERRTVDMLTIAADAVNDARVVAPDRNISLTVGSGAALLVVGDEARLRQVITNLMSNALNHTPGGTPIEVQVRSGSLNEWRQAARAAGRTALAAAGRDGQPVPAVVLEVADQGPGLTPYQAEHVFERFYRADQARTRKAGGAGLGLSIVAALVAAHGGNVWVESPPAGGATFRVAIPLAPEARHIEPDPDDGTDPDILDSHGSLASGPAPWPHPPPPGSPPPPGRPASTNRIDGT
jgi:two-component system, OmpR family, sensor kinase